MGTLTQRYKSMGRLPPPEQLHYETIEKIMQTSISSGAVFLFDKNLFDIELQRLWETYNVPFPVSKRTTNLHVLWHT
jgi:hypothetical protein